MTVIIYMYGIVLFIIAFLTVYVWLMNSVIKKLEDIIKRLEKRLMIDLMFEEMDRVIKQSKKR